MNEIADRIQSMIVGLEPDAPVVLPKRWVQALIDEARQPKAQKRLAPPARLMTAVQVAEEVFAGAVDAAWVTRHVQVGRYRPSHKKVMWRESELRAAIAAGERLSD